MYILETVYLLYSLYILLSLENFDLSLALLYSFDLLNEIGFLKDFRAAKPQRGSWQSRRRGRGRVQDSEADLFPCDDWSRLEIYGNHPPSAGRSRQGAMQRSPLKPFCQKLCFCGGDKLAALRLWDLFQFSDGVLHDCLGQ